jgi:TolB-like protein/DNA-binding winged helix-turn-helix (wHTH) protein
VGFECYRIGDLILDVGTQQVTRNGSVVRVPRLSFKLLLTLTRHAPNVVSAEQIEQEVWAGLVIDRGTINKRVLLLRKSLGEDEADDPYITVIRGSGYRLVAPVDRLEAVPAENADKQVSIEPEPRSYSRILAVVAFGLMGLVIAFGLYKGTQKGASDASRPAATLVSENTQASIEKFDRHAIAVLPFIDLNDDRVHQYIGNGIAEEVITLLSGMGDLSVVARTSSFSFRDTPVTIGEIAAKLKVGTILEGSIRHADGQIRVTAQLIDTASGHHIWSQNYDRSFDQVFEVQDDIAFNIAQSLKLTLDQGNQLNSRQQMTGDIEAFKSYLKGRELLNNRIRLRSEGLHDALANFSAAIEKDPKFVKAYAGIATVYWLLTTYDSSLDKEAYYAQAEANARFALAIYPDSVEALSALAAVNSKRGNLVEAAKLFDQIRTMETDNSNILAWDATLHLRLGYFDEMIGPLSDRYEQDPLNEHLAWALSDALIYAGHPLQASSILQELEHFTYRDYYLGLCAIYAGNFAVAREFLRDVQMRSGNLSGFYADLLIDALEDPSLFEDTVQKFVFAADNGTLDRKVSFEALLILGSPEAFGLGLDPRVDIVKLSTHAHIWNNWAVKLRKDPRFKDWVSALGYVDFWRKFGWPDRCRPTSLDDFECV